MCEKKKFRSVALGSNAERAEARIANAESTAAMVRASMADELDRTQRAAYERARSTREEAVALLSSAREDSAALRSQAQEMLDAARAEVEGLARRRDDITSQLNNLSGVIEALAVTGPSTQDEEN